VFREILIKLTSFITIIILSIGCANISPHDNFKEAIASEIGTSIDNAPSYSWRHEKDLISSRVLPNGNIENKYKYYKEACVYFFEIDPQTRVIVKARFEGNKNDCVLIP